MEEKWINIKDFENYRISSRGDIKNKKNKKLVPHKKSNGYLTITLSKNGFTKTFYIHRLVAECFIENKNNKPCVNHKDGVRSNNNIENLEWVTYSENSIHSYKVLGYKIPKEIIEKRTKKFKENYKMRDETKIKIGIKNRENSCKKVLCIELKKEFSSAAKASEWLGLTKKTVCRACRNNKTSGGYHWKYIGEKK